jgi:hypothetical protein
VKRMHKAGAAFFVLISTCWPAEELTKERILAAGQAWRDNYDRYDPPADLVGILKEHLGTGLTVDVYLGLWCSDSKNNVPPFIKILDRLDAAVPVRYIGVPRKTARTVPYYVEEFKVERVPTFIFYREGREIGRIVENPQAGMIEDMLDIVLKQP